MNSAFIVISGHYVQSVTITRDEGEFCIVEFAGKKIRLRKSRIYATEAEAKAAVRPWEPLGGPCSPLDNRRPKEKSLYEQGY